LRPAFLEACVPPFYSLRLALCFAPIRAPSASRCTGLCLLASSSVACWCTPTAPRNLSRHQMMTRSQCRCHLALDQGPHLKWVCLSRHQSIANLPSPSLKSHLWQTPHLSVALHPPCNKPICSCFIGSAVMSKPPLSFPVPIYRPTACLLSHRCSSAAFLCFSTNFAHVIVFLLPTLPVACYCFLWRLTATTCSPPLCGPVAFSWGQGS
jgi:hypothetical protein